MRIGELGEGGLIGRLRRRFASPHGILGIGDDAAIIDPLDGHSLVFCADLVVENSHFLRDLHPADAVGYKAVAANVSDVGAMGGVAKHFVISLAVPADLDVGWVDGFYDGIERASRDFDVSLVGGDSASSEKIFADVAMIGWVRKGRGVLRSGARAGDGIYVTGALGGAMDGFERLRGGDRNSPQVQRHLYPQPRPRVGYAVADIAHAMIDVSDGLSTDLGHIVEESRVSARIFADRIPAAPGASIQHVLHGGEEYELIIVGPSLPPEIEGVPVTRIGEIVAAQENPSVILVDDGKESVLRPQGWQHF